MRSCAIISMSLRTTNSRVSVSLASETLFSLADYLDDSESEIWEGWRTSSESEDQNNIYVYEESFDETESHDSSDESQNK